MKRWITISIVVFSIIIASNAQADGFLQKFYFVGLWQGIDDFDGSEVQRSITLNNDGTFNIIGQEPYTNFCGNKRGKVTGTGRLEGGLIISDDFTITCYDPPKQSDEYTVEYRPDKLNGTLIVNAPAFPQFPETILHKISNR